MQYWTNNTKHENWRANWAYKLAAQDESITILELAIGTAIITVEV